MEYGFDLPKGVIYGDTLNINEKLDSLMFTDLNSEDEFIEELITLNKYNDISKYKSFIYKDYTKCYKVNYKDIKKELKKGSR